MANPRHIDPDDPIDQMAVAGARIMQPQPIWMEALFYPDRFDYINGELVRKEGDHG